MVAVVIAPILLTFFASIKTKADMTVTSPLLPPAAGQVVWDNYREVFSNKYLLLGFRNTIIILIVSLIFNVMFGTMTAFIIERFQFRGKKIVVSLFFMGMLIPTFVTEIARFRIINRLHLYNTLGAPIIIYIASDLMQLYIYRQFIQGLPVTLDEAALLDGTSRRQIFFKIDLPLLMPAITTAVITNLIGGFKLYDIIVTLTNGGPNRKSLSLSYYISLLYFNDEKAGYSAAVGIALFIIIFIVAVPINQYLRSREVEY